MKRRQLFGISGALAALALAPARAQALGGDNVDPALRDLMQANPLALLPVIVEMRQPVPPFIGGANVGRALEALNLLGVFGIPVAAHEAGIENFDSIDRMASFIRKKKGAA